MKRTKPFRSNEKEKHNQHSNFVQSLLEKRNDCNKPIKGKDKGNCK